MTNIKLNNYRENPKETCIETPDGVCKFIFDVYNCQSGLIHENISVLDVGCGRGNLSKYFFQAGCFTVGIDTRPEPADGFNIVDYINEDFLKFDLSKYYKPDLIISNPPWNNPERLYGRALLPEVFLKRIFDLYGYQIPVIFIVPFGFRLNQEVRSKRFRWLRDCGATIDGSCALPRDIFPDVNLQCEILFFNQIVPFSNVFLPEKYIQVVDQLRG